MNYRNFVDACRCLVLPRHVLGRALKFAAAVGVLAVLLAPPAKNSLLAQPDETPAAKRDDGHLRLHARTRVETAKGSGRFHTIEKQLDWRANETAVVVCDMWDDHWCRGAAARVAEMAPHMNEFLMAARRRGALIIHCPSECMEFYKDTPQRRRAMAAAKVETSRPLERWCGLDKDREAALPIDDADGGCDCDPQCKHGAPWKRQIATLEIAAEDAITDNAEAYYLMRERGIKNVVVLGVHANMCVLGRPFSIRQMVYQGQNVVLVRDLTDTMYNSRSKPIVSHFTGTDLVVEHIERHWCPTILSTDLAGDKEFRFAEDKRPTVAVLMAEDEYETERTLTDFAREHLAKDMRTSLIYGNEKDRDDVPGIEAIRHADVLLVSARRRVLPTEQLKAVRDHVAAGKGVVGIRTASHGFSVLGSRKVESGRDVWPEFDHDVLGGNYTGHYGQDDKAKDQTVVRIVPAAADHPILHGVGTKEFAAAGFGSPSWLYKVSPLAATATPLLMGRAGDNAAEPVAWTNRAGKCRVFYTSLGHKDDFKNPAFVRLLENGVRWAAAKQ
ncbi:MAG: ThuA domain-containing protein [Pirellulales bacterium]